MANQTNSCPLTFLNKTKGFVKPSKPTPSEVLDLSTLDNDPFNDVMYHTVYVYEANDNDDIATRDDPESLIKEALSNLLVYYYPLAGKLKRRSADGRLQLTCTDSGVPFVVATTHSKLSSLDYLERADPETLSFLTPAYDAGLDQENDNVSHPLALQVTKFSCGGFVIGMALTHAVCDGFGVARFFRALTDLASGKSEPAVKPVWERDQLLGKPDDLPAKIPGSHIDVLGISPYMPTDDVVSETFNVKADSVKRLKEKLTKESSLADLEFPNESFTTFEILGAYVWRSRCRALKLNQDGTTVLGIAVEIRRFLDPPLPEGFYGNAAIDTYVELTAGEVNELPLSKTAKLIKRTKKFAFVKDYIMNELGNLEKLAKINETFEGRKDGLLFLTDWRNLGWFGSADFGWKDPVNLIPVMPLENSKNLCLFLRPSKFDPTMKGGVKVVVTLPRAAIPKFKEEMDALNRLGDETNAFGA